MRHAAAVLEPFWPALATWCVKEGSLSYAIAHPVALSIEGKAPALAWFAVAGRSSELRRAPCCGADSAVPFSHRRRVPWLACDLNRKKEPPLAPITAVTASS